MLVLGGQHNALTQCWLNVVPSFITLLQHLSNIVLVYQVACASRENEMFSECCFTDEPGL